ncbi:MAG: hypothetical protein ONB05_12220 [candidate division KSB1 bacterium]|nr:hypothetical protein [candidate division KSB1 bacterium]
MNNSENKIFTCIVCDHQVQEGDEFCPNCGTLFEDNVFCENHPKQEAQGVCIICCLPFCQQCGERVNDLFLCATHSNYEIYQGMARVFGNSDVTLTEYARQCLEQAGLHPFLYSRKASPISVGGPDYRLFQASGEFDGHIINEIKVMVPCPEVPEAEKLLRDLEILTK